MSAEFAKLSAIQKPGNESKIPTVTFPPRFGVLAPEALLVVTWLSEATSAIAITAATLRRPPVNNFFIMIFPLRKKALDLVVTLPAKSPCVKSYIILKYPKISQVLTSPN